MKAKTKSDKKPRKRTGTRIVKWVLAIVIILIALTVLLIPAIVSSGQFRRIILAKINKSVDGQTDFADLSMGWSGDIKVGDLSFNDDAGRVSVEVKQIETKPHYGALLTGNLSFGRTTVDRPKVQINLKQPPPAQADTPPPVATKAPGPVVLPIGKIDLVVKDGTFRITDPKSKTVELSQINSRLNLRPAGQETDFDLTMVVADAGKPSRISAAGSVTPGGTKKGWKLKGTTGDLTVEVNDLDLGSLEPFFALAGVDVEAAGVFSADLKSSIKNGEFENLTGTVKGKNLDVAAAPLKGDKIKTSALDIDIRLTRQKELMNIDSLKLKTDWADVTADGALPTSLKSLDDLLGPDSKSSLKGNFNVDVAALSTQMPKTLGLKEGTQITSGRLEGNIQTTAAADRRQITAHASLTDLKGAVQGKPVALSRPVTADALISSDKAGMSFDRLDLLAPFARINCTGTTEQIKYDADLDLAKLQSELGQFVDTGPYKIAGALLDKGQISLKKDNIVIAGTSTVKNLSIIGPNAVTASMPAADVVYALDIDKANSVLNIDSVNAETSIGRVTVNKGLVPLNKKSAKPMNLIVNAADVDLAKVRPFAVLLTALPKDTQLAGILESGISITSEKDTYKVTTDSTRIKDFKFASAGKKPFDQKEVLLVADLQLNPVEQTYSIEKMQLLSEKLKVNFASAKLGSAEGQRQLAGRATIEYDWDAVTNIAEAYLPKGLPKGLQIRGQRTTSLNFSSRYPAEQKDGLLANLNTDKCKVGFESAGYVGLNVGPTDVNIVVENGVLKVEPFTTSVNNGLVNLSANADFRKTPGLLTTTQPITIKGVQINDTVSRELLAYINPIFADAANVTGVAGFTAERLSVPLGGKIKNDITIGGTIAIDQLRLRPGGLLGELISLAGEDPTASFRINPTGFVVENGFVTYDNMQLDIGSTPVIFKGAIPLDKNGNMSMTVTIPLGRRGLRIGGTTVLKRVSLPLTGPIHKPRLDTKAIEKEIPNMIFEGILDSLGNR